MPVLADGGLLWVIIIVGSIIAQIIKAKKNAASPPSQSQNRQSGAGGDDLTTSGEELRNFLESIGGVTKPTPPQVRQPQPIPVRPIASAPPPLPPQVTIKHRPLPAETVLKPRQIEGTIRKPRTQKPEPHPEQTVTPQNPIAQLIKQDLKSMNAARKAVVLREILGPPIALR